MLNDKNGRYNKLPVIAFADACANGLSEVYRRVGDVVNRHPVGHDSGHLLGGEGKEDDVREHAEDAHRM